MAEESEKRFDEIMKKLFHAPSNSRIKSSDASGVGAPQLSGRKRPHSSSAGRKLVGNELGGSLSVLPAAGQAPVCRPWDRGDLVKRLSTFKSMTWFAKPQVVSPLECARRGWVNVDMDTIACVSCNTRLLFSTPSAWGKQQVEKAAMVFSLKLEGGHNLLCPWTNNSCAEELAQFPVLSRASLIEDYKGRILSLSQLIALPVIVPVAIDDLIASQLEKFLSDSSSLGYHEPLESSGTESSGHVLATSSSILYYQAQKLISLLGWEPRILPYRVDFKDGQNYDIKDANVTIATGHKPKDNIQSSSEDSDPSSELQVDPSCVVLDCKLCGASVGLWAFTTIPRPLEYIRFVGFTEVTDKGITAHDEAGAKEGSSDNRICTGSSGGIGNTGNSASTSSGFTIAGGPPPASLNYGATISLPIVGRNLRARLPIKTGNKDHSDVQVEDQAVVQQSETISAEETFVTIEPNAIADKPLEAPESVAEGTNLNLSGTEEGVNSAAAGELSSSTPEDITSITNAGELEPHREQMSGNQEEGGSYGKNYVDSLGIGASQSEKPMLFSTREHKKLLSFSKPIEFDPIKQHRHFCPWILSTGKSAPGWLQTLSALEENKELSNVCSSSLVEVDDPLESVRTLFTSPDKKRAKICGGSC
ncbi:uncharacterized protein LOC125216978 isoform X1 [Salvia hispanica]|uniref:uncharacterized protein LOC125216978 isoform X1 n=1 Tax=Salvia hispanica TaxID=49212 RepID=UPI0020091F8B|nr:uncharacterized protein LOC125216978 isoform X1 [Salvia hispanica]